MMRFNRERAFAPHTLAPRTLGRCALRRARLGLVSLGLAALFAACAPAASPSAPVQVQQLSSPVSFYPQESGVTWQYLPSGSSAGDPSVVQTIEGPTVVSGDLWVVTRLRGLGLDNRMYRQYRPQGVFLQREVRPGQQVIYDPPIQEYPPEGELRVGATWGGDTTITVFHPDAKPEEQYQTHQAEYRFTVVDRRPVTVTAGTYTVYVIDFEARFLDEGRSVLATQKLTTWFTPHVGEIKTENDFFLVATNAPAR
jgi:hypothetical protein